jgi:hypothetical protein
LKSDHLTVTFSFLDTVNAGETLDLSEKLTHWELIQSLAFELISPNIPINLPNEAGKAARDFAASTASAYRISAKRTTIIERKYEIYDLDHL